MTTMPGLYGKLASRGDFVSRGLPQSFIAPWDSWLAAGLLASQNAMGEHWLNAYLVSPCGVSPWLQACADPRRRSGW